MKGEKRRHFRVPVTDVVIEINQAESHYYEVKDISPHGCYVTSHDLQNLLKRGSKATLSFTLPGDLGHMKVVGRVVRVNWAAKSPGMAIHFDLPEGKEILVSSFVDYLRNQQIIKVSRRIIDSFYSSKGLTFDNGINW